MCNVFDNKNTCIFDTVCVVEKIFQREADYSRQDYIRGKK